MNRVAGICVAAGGSTRMGHPKALLDIGGRPAAEVGVATLSEGGCEPVVLVIGADAERIRSALQLPPEVLLTENIRWAEGRTGSIARGIAAVPDADAYVLQPVDHPLVTPGDVEALLDAWREDTPCVVRIQHGGRGGHPVLFDRSVAEQIAALSPDAPLRDTLRAHAGPVVAGSAGVLVNVDTPEDFDAIR